jgi:hydrogenase/urease accessory protein HupE
MKMRLIIFACMFLGLVTPAFGHRLDEYLQAATIAVERDHVTLRLRLTPGVNVFSKVMAAVDSNGDGAVSEVEERAYGEQVRHDLSLALDHQTVELRLSSFIFPTVEEMKGGAGEILLAFDGDLLRGGQERTLILENHHLPGISVFLVNGLVPRDPSIHIVSQDRNYDQSTYQLNYTVNEDGAAAQPSAASQSVDGWMERSGSASLFKAFFYHGVHHILTGYDHLLFVTALVLAATTLWELVKVVSAFTIAHTLTLTLAALNLVHVSGRIVEPLIAGSIVFVAVQNVFWPRGSKGWSRIGAAFLFGLFHGLGFAGGLLEAMREMPSGTMFVAILAFSVGVEAGHQLVVLPSFGVLKGVRAMQQDVVVRTRVSMMVQRVGSAGISVAGAYYLCVALLGG